MLNKASLPYYIPIIEGRRDEVNASAQSETEMASSRNWTRLTESIFYVDNLHTALPYNRAYFLIYYICLENIGHLILI